MNVRITHSYIPIAECEICSALDEVETSFSKYGWDDMDRPLPPAAARLEFFKALDAHDAERHHIKRCPVCGIFYEYRLTYDYYVNGSEDEEELVRLTPAQARDLMDEAIYAFLMDRMREGLTDARPLTRRYAAKCLVSYYMKRQEMALAGEVLAHPDPEVVKGALFFLRQLANDGDRLPEIASIKTTVEALVQHADPDISGGAQSVLRCIEVYAGRR
ncbi:MAG TPA: hypothetical protein PLH19_09170 [Anaerolineae bacterium]|nr:hypothetical protein [Anaerolineae bacterium]HQH38687.1 hypothetical protein [Anaerolineae bacterium]